MNIITPKEVRDWFAQADDDTIQDWLDNGLSETIEDAEHDDFFGTEGFMKRFS